MSVLSKRRQAAVDDYDVYGDEQTGKYMGIEWRALRCYESSPLILAKRTPSNAVIFHWCGYVELGLVWTNDGDVPEKYKGCMQTAGRECTYDHTGTIGFDCGHGHDFDNYRDFPYVFGILKKTIRAIIQMVDMKPEYGPSRINDFINRRERARDGAVAVIGVFWGPPGAYGARGDKSDVAKIIARVIWSTRVFYK